MIRFLLMRSAQTALTVFIVLAVVFTAVRLAGDPVSLLAPSEATHADIQKTKQELGLSDPLPVQFVRFLGDAAHGEFGRSYRTRQPAMHEALDRIPNTLKLAIVAFIISIGVALPVGVFSAVYKGGLFDRFGKSVALMGQAMPSFWLGLLLILLFSVRLHWLPTGGMGGWNHYIMPAVTLSTFSMAVLMRITRSSMLTVLDSDFVRTAEWTVIVKHGLRNALIPIVTLLGLQVGRLFSGAVIVETIFAWPGMGRLAIQSISNSDYPVVQAVVILSATSIAVANLLVDLLYGVIDPRIRVVRRG
jgi:peptide/nickel transport system permease protein